jgi:two-component system nitrate/nitrite response regulator NarL
MPKVIRVAVVDDHPLFREGVVTTVNAAPEFEVVAEGKCGSDAVRIARQECPDIMLLDVNMSDDGIDAARKITTLRPSVKTVMLTSCDDQEHIFAARAAGVRKLIERAPRSSWQPCGPCIWQPDHLAAASRCSNPHAIRTGNDFSPELGKFG